MKLDQLLEALLFAAAKPFPVKRMAELTNQTAEEVTAALTMLRERLESSASGVMLQQNGLSYELVTHPEAAELVSRVVRDDAAGELTRPSVETLSILAYCGPMTRPELEQIRGVHSSIILRNLLLRGLIEEKEDARLGQPTFAVTFDFLNHLGLQNVDALPDYALLRGNSAITDVLKDLESKPLDSQV